MAIIRCPECSYRLVFTEIGNRGQYSTGSDFVLSCSHVKPGQSADAMYCPVLRAEVERVLHITFPPPDDAGAS